MSPVSPCHGCAHLHIPVSRVSFWAVCMSIWKGVCVPRVYLCISDGHGTGACVACGFACRYASVPQGPCLWVSKWGFRLGRAHVCPQQCPCTSDPGQLSSDLLYRPYLKGFNSVRFIPSKSPVIAHP